MGQIKIKLRHFRSTNSAVKVRLHLFPCAHGCTHTLAVEHDVLRLQVSVDDAFLVQVTKSHGDLCQVETGEKNKASVVIITINFMMGDRL